jgi:hypothetical protein
VAYELRHLVLNHERFLTSSSNALPHPVPHVESSPQSAIACGGLGIARAL